jgi:tellurite resistance protein TerC
VPDLLSSATGPWIGLTAALAVLLAIDLVLVRGRSMSARQAAVASAAWVGISLAFFAVLLGAGDEARATAFLTGYLVEKSLSLDNVFVFLMVFGVFAVPAAERHRLLTFGILGALVLRLVFIVAGVALLQAASWVSLLFAALLGWTAWRMWLDRHGHDDARELVEKLRRRLPIAASPLVAIVVVDLIFAIDSVPAILAITDDTFIVFAANAFALLGLRPLFFLVSDLVERLYYLKTALAALLGFIAVKMALGEVVGKIGPEISLPVIAAILGTGTVASLLRERRLRALPAET